MKKRIGRLLICVLCLTACLMSACGNSVFKQAYAYIQDNADSGGYCKLKNLKDSSLGSLEIWFSAEDREIKVSFFWDDLLLTYRFEKGKTVSVSLLWSFRLAGKNYNYCIGADVADLDDLSTLQTKYIDIDGEDVSETSDLGKSMVELIKSYIPTTKQWITSSMRVFLEDDSLTVHDLYHRK